MLWVWYEKIDGTLVNIPVDPNHQLAAPNGGWKIHRKAMPFNPDDTKWDDFARRIIGNYTTDEKSKRILNII